MQISHTFLSEIVVRDIFYNINEIPLYWVCDEFSPNFDYLKIFHCDILYHHNCNLIVFDDTAYKFSVKNKRLTFKIYWIKSYIKNNQILNNWHQKLIDISEIKYDEIKKRLYYFDYEENKNKVNNNLLKSVKLEKYHKKKEQIFNTIRSLNNDYSFNNEQKCIKMFEYEINNMSEFNLPRWYEKSDINNLFFLFRMFLSIKENIFYGYKITNIIQLLNIFNTKSSVRDLYWLLLMFIENGNYIDDIKKERNYSTFLNQKNIYLNEDCEKLNKYNEYLHWFFKEISMIFMHIIFSCFLNKF